MTDADEIRKKVHSDQSSLKYSDQSYSKYSFPKSRHCRNGVESIVL